MSSDEIFTELYRTYRNRAAYCVTFYGCRIRTTVTRNATAVDYWIADNLSFHSHRLNAGNFIVGLGLQWRPTFSKSDSPPAVIQLCIGRRCLVFQIYQAQSIPTSLSNFLSNPNITFVGVGGNRSDRLKLERHYNLVVLKGIEICDKAESVMGRRRRCSMRDLAEKILGYGGVKKPIRIGRSAWDAWRLKPEQIQYACVDAYIAFLLGLKLLH